jgi:hypothetical protein
MNEIDDKALEAYISASAAALGIPLEDAWIPMIGANLATTLRIATTFADFELPDDIEPAPVFEA